MYFRLSLLMLSPLLLSLSAPAKHGAALEASPSETHEIVRIWPARPPGTESWIGPEEGAEVTLPPIGRIHVITNVTTPTLTVFRPPAGEANGTAVVVLPGGSFRALAWDVDGLESARWLASKGVTAFVLKYRVRPPQKGESFGNTLEDFAKATQERRAIAVADAKQAIRVIRSNAQRYGIKPDHVGMMGFSAGAMATVEVALGTDPLVRPSFAVAMYGAALTPVLPGEQGPPMFVAAAQDDPQLPSENSVEIFERWTKAGRPAELHVYEKGGHGFGFRRHCVPADDWPNALEAWLQSQGHVADSGSKTRASCGASLKV